jgi:hypothetical protein
VAIRKTPLANLAEPDRTRIAKAIERGRSVHDTSDAETAIVYAIWILRRYRIGIILWFVTAVVSLPNTIQHQSIRYDLFTSTALLLLVVFTVLERLALRSLHRNQALIENDAVAADRNA